MKTVCFFTFVLLSAGCKSSQPTGDKQGKTLSQTLLAEILSQKQQNGVDFFAKGNSPASWTLEMDFGNIIRFKSVDGADQNSSAVAPVEDAGAKTVTYTTRVTGGQMQVVVKNEGCTDGLSGEKFNKKVTVTLPGKRYEGCGQYLFDAALEGKWILETINNRALSPTDFSKGLPEFVFELAKNRVSGHDGCNTVSSTVDILGSKLKFKPFVTTEMVCLNNKKENELVRLLNDQTIDYYFKDGRLVLYLADDGLVVFRKGS